MENLEACPFCGAEPLLGSTGIAGAVDKWHVSCRMCWARTHEYISLNNEGGKEKAVAAWNKRIIPQPAPVESAKAAAEEVIENMCGCCTLECSFVSSNIQPIIQSAITEATKPLKEALMKIVAWREKPMDFDYEKCKEIASDALYLSVSPKGKEKS